MTRHDYRATYQRVYQGIIKSHAVYASLNVSKHGKRALLHYLMNKSMIMANTYKEIGTITENDGTSCGEA